MNHSQWIEEIITAYSKPLVMYTGQIVTDIESAREIVLECLLQLAQQPNPITSTRIVQTWLYKESRKRCYAHSKKPKSSAFSALNPLYEREISEPTATLNELIRKLSATQQEVLWLRFNAQLAPSQIAEVIDIQTNEVDTHLTKCLMHLAPASQISQSLKRAQ